MYTYTLMTNYQLSIFTFFMLMLLMDLVRLYPDYEVRYGKEKTQNISYCFSY